jgi:hypothetical protein
MQIPSAPLFRDPIFDGAADPTIIWNNKENKWWIIYTQRRAFSPGINLSWANGTAIGVASSADYGKTWDYRGTLDSLNFEPGTNTFWAPEVIYENGLYHMYVTYVRGMPDEWRGQRFIIHYTSADMWNWKQESILDLSSDRVIDACVIKTADGKYRMWYKDEWDDSHTWQADSDDLYTWTVKRAVLTDFPHEGINVFEFQGKYWAVADFWKGFCVYSSNDLENWERQKDILDKPGTRNDDQTVASHGDILVNDGRAFIIYHTHPSKPVEFHAGEWTYEYRRSSIQIAELKVEGTGLICNRDEDFDFTIKP